MLTLSWKDVEDSTNTIIAQMLMRNWRPDYVVGIVPHGLTPAVMIAQRLGLPMEALNPAESNCWMPMDATGLEDGETHYLLIVDGASGNGSTVENIKADWQMSIGPTDLTDIWHNRVMFATVVENAESKTDIDFVHIHLSEPYQQVHFPWQP